MRLLLFALSASASIRSWADSPMSYMQTFGPAGDPVTRLNWGLTGISIAVSIIIGLLVLLAIFRKRPPAQPDAQGRLPLGRGGKGLSWIYIGVGISAVILFGTTIWNAVTLAAVTKPPVQPDITVEITAHQWWWEARYDSDEPSRVFVTANEIHIPVGKPVLIKLASADVIHSFWVPRLAGKTDVIPGQSGLTWLQADRPGVYRGQCGEYCGAQHAHMALYVVAEEPAQFDRWRASQLQSASSVSSGLPLHGQDTFMLRCGVCHTVRGTSAHGRLGPDLTHLMSRDKIASGTLDNNRGSLSAWVADPQAFKPGTRMPRVLLQPQELQDVVAYLETLK
jgi:cytochrome c oxidase subunit 2